MSAHPPSVAVDSARARWTIAALSAVVVLAVAYVLMIRPLPRTSNGPSVLPAINACLNGTAAVLLIAGWVCIRGRLVRAHRACMISAFAVSTTFLVTYLAHHAQAGSVPYRGAGALRVVYFALLVPHIVLAAAVVPLALLSLYRALGRNFRAHRQIARITFPIWLYVSISGVLVYLMLYHGV